MSEGKRRCSLEQPGNIGHRAKQTIRVVGERQEALAFAEAARLLVLGVDDDGERSDLAACGAQQGIGEQDTAGQFKRIPRWDTEACSQRNRSNVSSLSALSCFPKGAELHPWNETLEQWTPSTCVRFVGFTPWPCRESVLVRPNHYRHTGEGRYPDSPPEFLAGLGPIRQFAMSPGHGWAVRGTAQLPDFAGVTILFWAHRLLPRPAAPTATRRPPPQGQGWRSTWPARAGVWPFASSAISPLTMTRSMPVGAAVGWSQSATSSTLS